MTELNKSNENRMSDNQSMVDKAYEFACHAHGNQVDKGGKPYMEHVMTVANNFSDDDETRVVALMHDIVEDTNYTIKDIEELGFDDNIIEALKAITHDESMDYMEYVKNISVNEMACKVKIADLKHNMDISRIANPTDYDYKRIEKYKKALDYLEKRG